MVLWVLTNANHLISTIKGLKRVISPSEKCPALYLFIHSSLPQALETTDLSTVTLDLPFPERQILVIQRCGPNKHAVDFIKCYFYVLANKFLFYEKY